MGENKFRYVRELKIYIFLNGKKVGWIQESDEGYRYFINKTTYGKPFRTIEACKKSIEGDDYEK